MSQIQTIPTRSFLSFLVLSSWFFGYPQKNKPFHSLPPDESQTYQAPWPAAMQYDHGLFSAEDQLLSRDRLGAKHRSRIPTPPPNGMVPHPPPYLIHFAHATVTKLTFPYFCMHAAVARRAFSFCWMNPLAGFGGSIARNCGEMQILSSRSCSAQCTGRFNAQQMESYTYIHIQVHIHIHTYT